jgi:hypothetical protein
MNVAQKHIPDVLQTDPRLPEELRQVIAPDARMLFLFGKPFRIYKSFDPAVAQDSSGSIMIEIDCQRMKIFHICQVFFY